MTREARTFEAIMALLVSFSFDFWGRASAQQPAPDGSQPPSDDYRIRYPEGELNSAGETLKYYKKVKELPANETRHAASSGLGG